MEDLTYEPYYFSEMVGEKGLEFDYQLKKGLSLTRNAVRILEFIGYPKEVVEKINSRIVESTFVG